MADAPTGAGDEIDGSNGRTGTRRARSPRARGDRGATFVEVLVAIVLLGTTVVATLTAVRTTIIGTGIARDHARAQQWLQSAVGVVHEIDRLDCDVVLPTYSTGEESVRGEYQRLVRSLVATPGGWNNSQITVITPVKVWDGSRYWDPYDPVAPAPCFDNDGFELQLITLQVTSPDGAIIESVQVVKDA